MKLTPFLSLGRPFSPVYAAIMHSREYLYRAHLLASEKPAVPVISVGNLVVGGSGKTPMVQYLTRFFHDNGCKPAIISRGYKGEAKKEVNIVAYNGEVLLSAQEAGDEPFMLAATLPQAMVLTGKKRIQPAKKAIEMGADCLLLDDGFQHLAIQRDIDIVLFDASYQAGNSRLLPAGPLREPVTALRRADCFVITGTTKENKIRAEKFAQLLAERFPNIPLFFAGRTPLFFRDCSQNHCDTPTQPALAFCGIAQPQRFQKSLEESDVTLQGVLSFTDHTVYTPSHIKKIEKKARECGAKLLITTEKDGVKLRQHSFSIPLLIAGFEMTITEDFTTFLKRHPALSSLCKR